MNPIAAAALTRLGGKLIDHLRTTTPSPPGRHTAAGANPARGTRFDAILDASPARARAPSATERLRGRATTSVADLRTQVFHLKHELLRQPEVAALAKLEKAPGGLSLTALPGGRYRLHSAGGAAGVELLPGSAAHRTAADLDRLQALLLESSSPRPVPGPGADLARPLPDLLPPQPRTRTWSLG